jgi:hypothetical protein
MNSVINHPTEGFEVRKFAAGFIQRQSLAMRFISQRASYFLATFNLITQPSLPNTLV